MCLRVVFSFMSLCTCVHVCVSVCDVRMYVCVCKPCVSEIVRACVRAGVYMCAYVCVRACVCACVHAFCVYVRVCVRA